MARAGCSCGQTHREDFDAQEAFENLSHKFRELSNVVAQYMSEAHLERPQRSRNAVALASNLLKIVGGKPTLAHPECCLVGNRAGNHFQWFCTGALIHPRVVVTAGHCNVPKPAINTVALNVSSQDDLTHAEILGVRRKVTHPGYLSTRQLNDITVLILRSNAVTPPVPVITTAELNAATDTTLVGFGNSDFNSTIGFGLKREVSVPITFIRRAPADNLDEAESQLGFESDLEFVAGGGGRDSCNGDSGGPAYVVADGIKKLAGLTSRATDTATHPCGDAGIYTRIDANFDFVRKVALDQGIHLA